MTTSNETFLKTLFKVLQPGCLVTVDWLKVHGISRNLQNYYLKVVGLSPLVEVRIKTGRYNRMARGNKCHAETVRNQGSCGWIICIGFAGF